MDGIRMDGWIRMDQCTLFNFHKRTILKRFSDTRYMHGDRTNLLDFQK